MMRVYLVLVDDSPEAATAVRFAARRAAKTAGAVRLVTMVDPVEFSAFALAQATMEAEAREAAEARIAGAAAIVSGEGVTPDIAIRTGDAPQAVRAMIDADRDIAALVLGAAPTGAPGPLVAHFTGAGAGSLPCPVMVIPGGLSPDALERLS